jgi:4-amino-4-deoxychorismate lyase
MIHYRKGEYTHLGVPMDPAAPAFRYGAGFYETIYHNGRKPCHLDLHLDRLLHSLRAYGARYEAVDFEAVIGQVINRNGLAGKPARVNIFYPMETPAAHPVIMAAPYEPRPYKAYRLCLCEDRHVSSLGAHKTTNAMFYHLARAKAVQRGFDDAVLLDFDDRLLETAAGALLLRRGDEFFETESPYRLASTSLWLARTTVQVAPRPIPLHALPEFEHAYILNALIGMRPVVTIGEVAFVPDEDTCRDVSELILEDPA